MILYFQIGQAAIFFLVKTWLHLFSFLLQNIIVLNCNSMINFRILMHGLWNVEFTVMRPSG